MADVNGIDPRGLSTAEFSRLFAPDSGDMSEMDPQAFSQLIKHASTAQLEAVLGEPPLRRALLDRIFSRMTGQFRPESAPGQDSAIHWRITGGPAGDEVYETWITSGTGSAPPRCSTSNQPSHDPRVTLTLSGTQFLLLASGSSSPTMMFVTGKVQLDGDIGFAAQLAKVFDIPKS